MANYYHEARAQVRGMKRQEESNRRRAERRAELATARDVAENMLAVHGRACNVHRNTEEYENSEHMKVMMPWNGDAANLIDRFDARANLDMYREPPATRPKLSDADKEIEERVAFESFRDLVKLTRRGLSDEEGLAFMEDEALNLRVAARTRASASAGLHVAGAAQAAPDALFGPAEAEAGGEEGADAAEDEMIESVATGAEALDAAGAAFGIATFSAQLQRAVVQEEEEAEASEFVKKPKRISRRKMAEAIRRMLGQGLQPFGRSKAWWRETLIAPAAGGASRRRRASPDYGDRAGSPPERKRSRNSPRRVSPDGAPAGGGREYISEFRARPRRSASASDSDSDGGGGGAAPSHDAAAHLEAAPGSIDPAAAGGPVALPAAAAVMRGRTSYSQRDAAEERAREATTRARIAMNRAGGAPAAAPAGKAESRAERLRRLTAAQFNSSVARDTKKVLDKRAREEGDRRAREAIERSALALPRAPADPRNRGADRRELPYPESPPPRRSRSHSRSRSPPGRRGSPRRGTEHSHDQRDAGRSRERHGDEAWRGEREDRDRGRERDRGSERDGGSDRRRGEGHYDYRRDSGERRYR